MKSEDALQPIPELGEYPLAAEPVRSKDGNLDRAKKFLEQEAKWRAKMAQSDEAIYKDYKAQGRDSRSGIGANTLRMAAQAMKKALVDGKTLAEATKVYQDTLAALLSKAQDVALIPEADGAQFIKPTDGAREAFKGWTKAKAQDGILSSPFMALAALLAILSHFNKETVGPNSYDLRTYQPKRKEW